MLKGRLKFIIAFVIIALTVSYLIYGGVKDTMVYYFTVEELMAKVPDIYDSRVRVSGNVVPGSINTEDNDILFFSITDGKQNINVSYRGIVPDIFKDDVEAVVEGRYGEDNVFKADTLLAKCPTKYESTDELYKQQNQQQEASY